MPLLMAYWCMDPRSHSPLCRGRPAVLPLQDRGCSCILVAVGRTLVGVLAVSCWGVACARYSVFELCSKKAMCRGQRLHLRRPALEIWLP